MGLKTLCATLASHPAAKKRASLVRWEFGHVKPGRSTNGGLPLEKTREAAAQLARAREASPLPPVPVQPPPPSSEPALLWQESTNADAQLRIYLDRAKEPKRTGFPPLEALSARIGEFSEPPYRIESRQVPDGESWPDARRANDLQWFEDRFQELKTMLSRRDADSSEIVAINVKLAEIIDRVDRLSAALPGEKAMAKVETQLAALSRSFEASRAQSSADANRIARAAKEILVATEKAQDARAGFEESARHTVKELGQTVVVSASHAAAVTAEQIAAALHERTDGGRLDRMESELRALNTVSRETCEKTTAALERVHETLRAFLERINPDRPAPAPRKRVSVHNPISSGDHPYAIGEDFGSEPGKKPRLDTITLRKPPPPDPALLNALKEASEKLVVSKASRLANPTVASKGSGLAKPQEGAPSPSSQEPPRPLFHDEEKALPLLGLAVVAAILLIASAALYYLHTQSEAPSFHLSVLPNMQSERLSLPSPQRPIKNEAAPGKPLAAGSTNSASALLTASDANHAPAPSSSPAEQREDLQALTNAASRGDREAQFRIAARFLSDGAVQNDPSTAARWLARAAEQGHVESEFVLASLYERGVGVEKNAAMARELYRRAASANHSQAMHNLGVLLCAEDTPQDYQEAAAWFASAAMSGLTDSQFNLAVLYERGLGLQRNNQKAYFWYQVASLAGDKEAQRQADRIKRQLTDGETQAVNDQVGAWRPSFEQHSRAVSGSASHS